MNTITKCTLALGVAALLSFPASSQAYDPFPRDHWVGHQYHHGLQITTVSRHSPAAHAGLECGDIIFEVDGRRVDQPEELHRALHRTGYRGVLTVRDARTGRFREVRVYPQAGHIGVNVARIVF